MSEFEADLEDAVDEAGVAGVDEARDAARPLLRPEGGRTHEDVEADGHGAAQREAGEVVRHEPGHGHGAGHVSRVTCAVETWRGLEGCRSENIT